MLHSIRCIQSQKDYLQVNLLHLQDSVTCHVTSSKVQQLHRFNHALSYAWITLHANHLVILRQQKIVLLAHKIKRAAETLLSAKHLCILRYIMAKNQITHHLDIQIARKMYFLKEKGAKVVFLYYISNAIDIVSSSSFGA